MDIVFRIVFQGCLDSTCGSPQPLANPFRGGVGLGIVSIT